MFDWSRSLAGKKSPFDRQSRSRSGKWNSRLAAVLTVAALLPATASAQFLAGSGADPLHGVTTGMAKDGNTVIIGDSADGGSKGAAWIFKRTADGWVADSPKLASGDSACADRCFFGGAVGMSADGRTAIVGASGSNGSSGAAWIFTRNASGWVSTKLTPNEQSPEHPAGAGWAVALSGSGDVAVIGGPDRKPYGAVWVFARTNGAWSQKQMLVATPEGQWADEGRSVAISSSGDVILVGGPGDNAAMGAAWVWRLGTGGTYSQQAKLVGTEGAQQGQQGWVVSLSGNGATALVSMGGKFTNNSGVPEKKPIKGQVFSFNPADNSWTYQTALINPTADARGTLRLSEDGYSAAIGMRGSVFIYTRYNGAWALQETKTFGSNVNLNASVAISGDGAMGVFGILGGAWIAPLAPPRTVWGVVNPDGSIRSTGGGFTLARNGSGSYQITFDPPFRYPPAVYGSQVRFGNGESAVDNVIFPFLDEKSTTAVTGDGAGHAADRSFAFTATGISTHIFP